MGIKLGSRWALSGSAMDGRIPRRFPGRIRKLLLIEDTNPQRDDAEEQHQEDWQNERKLYQGLSAGFRSRPPHLPQPHSTVRSP